MDRRAVITGLGIVSPLGIGKEANWKNLIEGTSGIKSISRFDTKEVEVSIAGEITDFKARDFIKDRKAIKLSQPMVHLAIAAAQLSVQDAGVETEDVDPSRFGAFIGSGGGGFEEGPGFPDLVEPLVQSWSEE